MIYSIVSYEYVLLKYKDQNNKTVLFLLDHSIMCCPLAYYFPHGNICQLLCSRTGRIRWDLLPHSSPESFKTLRNSLESRFTAPKGGLFIPKRHLQTIPEGVSMQISRCCSSFRYTAERFKMQWRMWATSW